MTKWISLQAEQPPREQVYLVYSPNRGYDTAMWENKRPLRQGWDGVTHWAQFDFIPKASPK